MKRPAEEITRPSWARARAAAVALAILGAASCADRPPTPATPHRLRVLLVGIDGLDPDLLQEQIAAGRMPVLAALARRGASGRLRSLEPMISPLLWTTVATGTTPDQHGVTDFVEPDPATGELRSISQHRRRRPAVWDILGQHGRRTGVVGFWATYPADSVRGFQVADRLVSHGFRTNPAVSTGLVHPPELLPTVLAAVARPESFTARDLSGLADGIDEASWMRRRSAGPEDPLKHLAMAMADARTLASVTVELARREPVDVLMVYFEGVDTVSHLFMSARGDASSPWRATVDAFHAYQDALLAPIVALAGDDATVLVISDHGFRHGADRPPETAFDEATAVRWHRIDGTILAAGPGIAPGSTIAGGLLDVAPTILALCGVPAAADMPGRPIAGVARETAMRVASYGVRNPPSGQGLPAGDPELVERLRALGYLAPGATQAETAAARFNRARSLHAQGDLPGAVAAYEATLRLDPQHAGALVNLGGIAFRSRRMHEAAELFQCALAVEPSHAGALNNLALVLMEAGTPAAWARAEELLRRSVVADPGRADARKNLAMVLARRNALGESRAELSVACRLTPEDGRAWEALADVCQALGDGDGAREARSRAAQSRGER